MLELDPDLLTTWLISSSTGSEQREQAIRDAAGTLTASSAQELLDLVALAHQVPDRAAAGRVRDAVAEHDPGFRGRPTDRQTQVAAAWAVAATICGDDQPAGLVAAFGTASAAFAGHEPRGPGLTVLAGDLLSELSNDHRRRQELGIDTSVPKVLAEFKPLTAAGGQDAQAFLEATQSAIRTLASRVERVCTRANQRLAAADEELDLLWWTVRGRRDGTPQRWSELGNAAAILAGLDVVALTCFPSPIGSMATFLTEALDGLKATTLGAAVEAAAEYIDPREDATEHLLLPVTTALQLCLAEPTTWRKAAENKDVTLSVRPSPSNLAEQVLREELMRRLL